MTENVSTTGDFGKRGRELQPRCMARLHSLAIREGDLDAWVGHFTVDVWHGTGDVGGGTPGVDHCRKIVGT
jgi:hypothetical protein